MAKPVRKFLVVARYKEDVDWVRQLSGWKPIIIQKATEEAEGDMPNVGREPSSFFFAIAQHYNRIKSDDVWAFVQGNPFDHCPDVINKLNKYESGFRWLGGRKTTDGQGNPDHPGLPVAAKYAQWFDREFSDDIHFAPGGQHIVTGERILKHPLDFYLSLMDDFTTAYNAWVAERLWEEIYA